MIRCDKHGIPTQVQRWQLYRPGMIFYVELINGNVFKLDAFDVRDYSCRNYGRWDKDADQMAIDEFVAAHRPMFFIPERS